MQTKSMGISEMAKIKIFDDAHNLVATWVGSPDIPRIGDTVVISYDDMILRKVTAVVFDYNSGTRAMIVNLTTEALHPDTCITKHPR